MPLHHKHREQLNLYVVVVALVMNKSFFLFHRLMLMNHFLQLMLKDFQSFDKQDQANVRQMMIKEDLINRENKKKFYTLFFSLDLSMARISMSERIKIHRKCVRSQFNRKKIQRV